jgi:hypothetical protein
MFKRLEFFLSTFRGLGLGITFSFYDNCFICVGTFLCFNTYFELNLGKIY